MCEACATYDIDGHAACAECGCREAETSRSIATALFACVGVGYLTTLAIAVSLSPPRPWHGGIAAVVALLLGRALQFWLKPRTVTRRPTA
jgi:hypothetical protein